MLFAALIAACAIAPEAAKAAELEQTVCRNGTREAVCSVKLDDNSLELKLEPDLMLQARRLGRWRTLSSSLGPALCFRPYLQGASPIWR